MKKIDSSRRDFLKYSALLGSLPFLAKDVKAAPLDGIKRLVLIQHPDGIIPEAWYPIKNGDGTFSLPEMTSPFNAVKDDCVFIRGINMVDTAGHGAYQALYRGDKSRDSIDQYFAEKWRGNTDVPILVHKTSGGYGGRDLSYDARGRSIPSITDVDTLRDKIYTDNSIVANTSASVERESRRLASIKKDLDLMMQGNFIDDDVLATHKKAVDDVLSALNNIDTSATPVNMADWKAAFDARKSTGNSFDDIAYAHEDIILNALKFDRCRVFNYSFGADVWDYNMPCDDGNSYPYHNSGHAMDNGAVQTRKQTSKHVAQFIEKLKTTNDLDGNPLIDTTLVVYSCEIGHAANHSGKDVPFIMAGAGLEGGRFLEYDNENWNAVLVSIARILGENISSFGSFGSYSGNGLDNLV